MPVLVTLILTTAGWSALIRLPSGRPWRCTAGADWLRLTVNGSISAVPDTVGAKSMISVQRPGDRVDHVRLAPRVFGAGRFPQLSTVTSMLLWKAWACPDGSISQASVWLFGLSARVTEALSAGSPAGRSNW